MLRNYLITALRNLKRNKIYTLLNVFGLALGIGCALVIYKVITYELSYDKHHENYENIYRVVYQKIYPDHVSKDMGSPHPLANALKSDYPEIDKIVRTHYIYGNQLNTYNEDGSLNKYMIEEGITFTENSFFEIFTIPWIAGDKESALSDPNTVVIAASQAQKIFGLEPGQEPDAIGRIINFNNIKDFKVVGIIEDPVETTSLPFTYLFEYESQKGDINPYFYEGTEFHSNSSNTNTYFIPKEGFDKEGFEAKLPSFVEKYFGEGSSEETVYIAQPFSEIHFDKEYGSYPGSSSKQFIMALGIIGLFLLLTACINFINLATAQAANRAKEIGIRKAIGSMSGQLIAQFMAEISLITFFSLLIALMVSELMFEALQDTIGYHLSLDLLHSPATILFLLVLFVTVSLLSGFYPAVLLSRMNAVDAIRRKISAKSHSGGLGLRKGLVVLQFTISQFLIIGTLIISSQTDYFLSKDLGFKTDAIMSTYLPERDEVKMERFRQQMLNSSAIENVSFSLSEPTGNNNSYSSFNHESLQSEQDYHGNFKSIDPYYTDLFDIELLAGRNIKNGDTSNVLVNKKVADLLGFESRYPELIGEKITTGWGDGDKTIVGVIENFHTVSLESKLDFIIMFNYPFAYYSIAYKVKSLDQIESANAHFEEVWNTVYPEYVLRYDFYDKKLAERYEEVQHITSLMEIFAVISILIGCLGLYGLISFIAINRTKEIGVRKVLGASTFNILGIFSKEIILLITIAFVITTPAAFYLLDKWLDNFVFRISISPGFFAVAFAGTLLIAIVTISYKTITTALINPAETLKDD